MAALINQNYRNGRPLKDHEIAHIMIALLMAGQHTSSATGSWALLHLADRPDILYVAVAFLSAMISYYLFLMSARLSTKNKSSTLRLPMVNCVK